MENGFDVIIVGSGSAGCALAARLSEDPTRRVLLLEAGPRFVGAEAFPPELRYGGSLSAMSPDHPNNWGYVATVRSGVQQSLPRGRVVGGSSAVNGTLFTRGLPEDFDGWAEKGNTFWSYDSVLPFYKRLERDLDIHDEYHGSDGPVPVRRAPRGEWAPVSTAFMEACKAAGFPEDTDMNGPKSIGVGALPVNTVDGIRVNAALAYLDPIGSRKNLEIRDRALVTKIALDGRRAVGVEVREGSGDRTYHADEVILSAGAVESPHLLMRSGIGPADQLSRVGIPVVLESPLVGQEFTDHLSASVHFQTRRGKSPSPDPRRSAWTHTALHYTTEGSDEYSDMMLIQSAIPMNKSISFGQSLLRRAQMVRAGLGEMSLVKMVDQLRYGWSHSISSIILQGASRGEIVLNSDDPLEKPTLLYHYLDDPRDRTRLRDAIRLSVELVDSEPYRELGARRLAPSDSDLESDEALDKHLMKHVGTSIHMSSTCRMGQRAEDSVVDQECRVHGLEGLRVVDTSIMPTVVRRCPAATAIMIGERASAFFG